MFYKAKEFTAKNGKRLIAKTPEISDAKDLVQTMITITTESANFLIGTPETFSRFLQDLSKEEDFIKSKQTGEDYLICVYDNGKIIGDCDLRFFSQEKAKHRCEVGIALLQEYQNFGIGSFLFDELIALAKSKSEIEQIELDVVSTNERAKHLYTKKGFVKVGDIPHQIKQSDGTYCDGEKMVLFLK